MINSEYEIGQHVRVRNTQVTGCVVSLVILENDVVHYDVSIVNETNRIVPTFSGVELEAL